MSRLVYLNGELVPEREAKVSIYDSALMFGDMVFEMTRSFGGVQFRLREHLERLYASMRYVRIPAPMPIVEMERLCGEVQAANAPLFDAGDEHRLMINVSRGPLGLYSEIFDGRMEPTVVIADFPLKWTVAAMGHLFDSGINAVVPSQRAIPAQLLDPKVKSRSRLHYQMANIEAAQFEGEDNWALLLDPDGYVAEGTGDNFFIVAGKEIRTPEPRNILRGVSRAYVFELAAELGLSCVEANLELYDVAMADEAFMTGTPFCMLPVTRLGGVPIGSGTVGPVFGQLLERWSANVDVDIEAQIKTWAAQVAADSNGASAPTPYQFGPGQPVSK
jgi:branched-chain amino acid aminotransferase